MPRTAVVIEDDADTASLLELALTSQGFEVRIASDGQHGVGLVAELAPDLVTLDVGLPGIDGLEVCRRIRPMTDAYVIMVTAQADEIDRLIGLETGADDYLAKPISVRELKARVNAMFRRPRRLVEPAAYDEPDGPADGADAVEGAVQHEVLRHGDLVVDVDAHRVLRDGEEVGLTRTEFELLVTLMRAPSRVWPRTVLMQRVWGQTWGETHHVEVHMGNLRRKLGDRRGQVRFVETVRGVGYRLRSAS
ncbi:MULTISPECIES: response regulator transcription factor [Nocardioides]|uniref:DNA-binding response OmpR family regulator n=1 Tax=Nocardioides soli TaxID=1036020 RepID=A0A7W4VVH5_9ACTN|nr:response regulator transcription factor [Nocardioides sp. LMS-CY]MBB3042268.1 DNA-binding response OmpR family regulator [Nocardioides soli]